MSLVEFDRPPDRLVLENYFQKQGTLFLPQPVLAAVWRESKSFLALGIPVKSRRQADKLAKLLLKAGNKGEPLRLTLSNATLVKKVYK